jgi:echinoderm microtubule-associated protein-like 5
VVGLDVLYHTLQAQCIPETCSHATVQPAAVHVRQQRHACLQVYGVAFNPRRPSFGRGCEFLTYGIKHLKSYFINEEGSWQGTAASFGPDRVRNVNCAAFVPAQHMGCAPGDSCIITGFPDGGLGLWVPPFPTTAGSRYALRRIFRAHDPGPLVTMIDGSQQYGGVQRLTVCQIGADTAEGTSRGYGQGAGANRTEVLSGGADGTIRRWMLVPPAATTRPDGLPARGAALVCAECSTAAGGCSECPVITIREPCLPGQGDVRPMIKGLDRHPSQPANTCIVGTSACDLWRITGTGQKQQQTVLDGHSAQVHMVATHPEDATRFVTADESGAVMKYNVERRILEGRTILGFRCSAIAISSAATLLLSPRGS